ncbi:MAG: hypothetical protein A3I66_06675 [Burkholderiales bacterium RIFCSPLOWO2_02_FULL_57_36]|nr:MAG: hypothetical protein A3I66_06675 [Burkholderiales bacterium RIFCSPLOWO2_02_FULL_57_36]
MPSIKLVVGSILFLPGFAVMLGWLLYWPSIAQLAPRTQVFVFNAAFAAFLAGGVLLWIGGSGFSIARPRSRVLPDTNEMDLRTIVDLLPMLISYIDRERRFQFNNHAYSAWLKRPLSEITGRHVHDVLREESYEMVKNSVDQALAGEEAHFQMELIHDGAPHHFRGIYLPHKDSNGKVIGIYGVANDITPVQPVENQLMLMAKHDLLTGLANRTQFNEKLSDAIARSCRSGLVMAVLLIDIDHFKTINDELTRRGGDQVLIESARRLMGCVRQTDVVARLAGDEFVIILEGMHAAEEATIVARKIIQAMERGFEILGAVRKITVSIGIAIRPDAQIDADALLHKGDEALYMAKAAGRNTYQLVH